MLELTLNSKLKKRNLSSSSWRGDRSERKLILIIIITLKKC